MKEENLIFIISQPRSGSTYLQNLLSNNKFINTCSEPWILLNYVNQIKPELLKAQFNNQLAKRAFEDYQKKYPSLDLSEKQKRFILNIYKPLLNNYSFIIDKTPRYWQILDEIREFFPNSKIIILKRNPIDVAKSIMITWDVKDFSALMNFRRDLILAPYTIQSFCNHNSKNKNVYVAKYEELINDPSIEVEKIYNWIGIEYSNDKLDISKNTKYRGLFGDPYQNSKVGYKEAKRRSIEKSFSKFQLSILHGYKNYLGKEFLYEYGRYELNGFEKNGTKLFSYFVHMDLERHNAFSLVSEFKYIIKQVFFRLFRLF